MVYRLSKKEGLKPAVFVAAVSLLLLAGCSSEAQSSGNMITDVITEEQISSTKTFALEGKNFRFLMDGVENPDLRVKLGDKIKIELNNVEGFHDWKLDELNAATEKVRAPASTSVTFVADKKGTFEYYCSVGSHREQGMKGKFIVE